METELHIRQLILLWTSLELLWGDRTDFYAAGNLTVYYSPNQKKSEEFRGPDFFVVLGVERYARNSWVVWEEGGRYPNVVIEILSDSTAKGDRSVKKEIYETIWKLPNYFWFDPVSLELAGFHLVQGQYQPLPLDREGRLWCEELGLYLGIEQSKLRFFTRDGELVLTPQEAALQQQQRAEWERRRAEQEKRRAEQERQQAEQERQRAERLAQQLRALGIAPDG